MADTYEKYYVVSSTCLLATADAIRAKTGSDTKIEWKSVTGFADAINAINAILGQLAAPENISVSASTLTFDSVENAESYTLLVDGVEITNIKGE